MSLPRQFDNVSVACKANIYFEGRVVSYSLTLADGQKVTLGLIYPGQYTFNTGAPERMSISAGSCSYRLAGDSTWSDCAAGHFFDVPGDSSFEIAVDSGLTEYICSFG